MLNIYINYYTIIIIVLTMLRLHNTNHHYTQFPSQYFPSQDLFKGWVAQKPLFDR